MLFRCPHQIGTAEHDAIDGVEEIRRNLGYALTVPARWYGVLRRATFARSIRGSNSIEGIVVSQEDAVAAIENEEPMDADAETWRAIKGYRDAMTFVLQLAKDQQFTLSEGFIRSLHFMITQYDLKKNPGRWRPGPIYVRNEERQEIVYEGPDFELVPGLMAELIEYLNTRTSEHPLIRAATAHFNLAKIHPFSDGNGRMARCLHTLVLAREGILEPVFSSIEEYLGRNTMEYYRVLEAVGDKKWNPPADCSPWINYVLLAHYRQAETYLRRIRETRRVWDELEELIKSHKLPERIIMALSDATFGYKVRNATYRAAAEIGRIQIASRDLNQAAVAGLIQPHGAGRGRYYTATDVLRAIRERARETEQRQEPEVISQLGLF